MVPLHCEGSTADQWFHYSAKILLHREGSTARPCWVWSGRAAIQRLSSVSVLMSLSLQCVRFKGQGLAVGKQILRLQNRPQPPKFKPRPPGGSLNAVASSNGESSGVGGAAENDIRLIVPAPLGGHARRRAIDWS